MKKDTPENTKGELNIRQAQFAVEYARTGNAAKSARNAGYTVKCAKEAGSGLLTKPNIKQAVIEERKKLAEKSDVTLKELIAMHRASYQLAIKVKAPNAMTAAAVNLAKLLGMVVDKSQVDHSGGLIVNIINFSDMADN